MRRGEGDLARERHDDGRRGLRLPGPAAEGDGVHGEVKNGTSPSVTATVLPRLRLGKVARHKYSLHISAGDSFAGKVATFQRYRSSTKRWVKVRRVLLQANTTGVAPTVITSAAFRSGIKAGVRVRVTLGQKQVGSCYLAGRSNTIRS